MLLDDFCSLIYLEDHLGSKDNFSDQAKFEVVLDIFVFQWSIILYQYNLGYYMEKEEIGCQNI